MKKFILGLSFSLLICSFGFAYVPPSDYQIKQILKKRSNLRSLRIHSRLTDGSNQLKETLWYDASTKMLYGKILDDRGELLYSYQKKLGETGVSATQILLEQNASEFNKILSSEKINTDDSSLSFGRVKQQVGWTIGLKSPSLWILKDEFLPLKWIPKSNRVDIDFLETKTQKDFPYARLITLNQEGKELLRVEAIDVTVNTDLSDLKKSNFSDSTQPPSKIIESLLQWIR